MAHNITKSLAQQIVNTVKDVCGQDINFIDQSGTIFASTNERRIGTFHEIGYKAFHTGTPIAVESDNSFTGTQKGINLPVQHNREVLAVIGITGDPQSVRKYAYLAERITHLLIREQELNTLNRTQADKRHFILHSLIGKQNVQQQYLMECLQEFGVSPEKEKRLLLLRLDSRFHPGNTAMIEDRIRQLFETAGIKLYAFDYPNEYLALTDTDAFSRNQYRFQKFCAEQQALLKLAVGKSCSLYQLTDSYQSALTAWKSISTGTESFVLFDDLTLEILLSTVDAETASEFLLKTTAALSEEDLSLLKIYFEEDMSLAGSCRRLFLHKNTLQYKLNRIWQKCGLNPRRFRDAAALYLAGILTARGD